MNKFSKVAECKIKIQRSVVFLYINNKNLSDKEISKPIYSSIKNSKILGINFSKDVRDLCIESNDIDERI